MTCKLLLLDIDGTLRPAGCSTIPAENVAAIKAVQKLGVKVAIATGRSRAGVPPEMLAGLRPDAWICAGGAQLADAKTGEFSVHRLTPEEMYALVDFFEDYDLPLRFSFHDANYAYIGYDEFKRVEKELKLDNHIVDGEDQDQHLVEMPFGAFGMLPQELKPAFAEKYGYLDLDIVYCSPDSPSCDILQDGVNKGTGLLELAEHFGIGLSETVAVGDGDNDIPMLQAARIGIAMGSGSENAKAAAVIVGPDAAPHGVADICRQLWPEAF